MTTTTTETTETTETAGTATTEPIRPRDPDAALDVLWNSSLLRATTVPEREMIAPLVRWIAVPAGTSVFNEGEPADGVFIVARGRLRLVRGTSESSATSVADVAAGEVVGELGVLLGQRRNATAVAVRDSLLAWFDAPAFEQLLESTRVLRPLTNELAQRLARHARPSEPKTTVWALIGDDQLTATLGDALVRAAPVDWAEVDVALASSLTIVDRVEGAAARVPFVLVRGRPDQLDMMLGAVDRVLVVARGNTVANLGSFSDRLHDLRDRQIPVAVDLVLVHSDGYPERTREWRAIATPESLTHIRIDRPGDIERLGRTLTRRMRALVAAGAGARGLAAIGAMEALAGDDCPYDLVVGCGTAAIAAAQLAQHGRYSAADRNAAFRAWRHAAQARDIPLVATFRDRALSRLVGDLFGTTSIEDCWIPLALCATDLSTAAPIVRSHGSLALWARAAAALPGLHPPLVRRGHLIADGTLVNPLPVDIARSLGATHVTALNCAPLRDQLVDERFTAAPSPFGLLMQMIPVIGTGFPGIGALTDRAQRVGLAEALRAQRRTADVLIEPPVDAISLNDYRRAAKAAELGALSAEHSRRAVTVNV